MLIAGINATISPFAYHLILHPSHLKTLHVHILHMIEFNDQLTYTEKLVYDTQIKIKTDYCQDTVYRPAC